MKLFAILLICSIMILNPPPSQAQTPKSIKLVMAGLSHGHSHWIFQKQLADGTELIGIYEPNQAIVTQFKNQYKLDHSLFYTDLDEMLDKLSPDGLLAFGPIYDHLMAVEAAAPRGIHVMVEKPLAVSWEHAQKMERLAKAHNIHLLTNYETSWYPSTEETYQLLQDEEQFGELRKVVFHHGHKGPKEIGVDEAFLDWLTDPKLNGGGALVDFGCYGANIMTYFMKGLKPSTVTAITKTFKPEIYQEVEDEATIVLTYPDAQAIIQASWNWPFDRKDMEAYGAKGQIVAPNPKSIHIKSPKTKGETRQIELQVSKEVYQDPFAYFADVIRGKIKLAPHSLYALDNNMVVMEILEAAKISAENGETVVLK